MFGQYNTKVTTVESRATTTLTLIENIVYLTVKTSCYARKEKKSYTFINTIKYLFFFAYETMKKSNIIYVLSLISQTYFLPSNF